MALINFALLDSTLLDNTSGSLITEPDLDYWITIQETVIYSVKIGSLAYEQVLNGRSSLSFILINPSPVPQSGQTVKFIDAGKLRFGGFIESITLRTDQSESVKEYSLSCVGWEGQLERALVKRSDTNQLVDALIRAILNDGGIPATNGFTLGYYDPSPVLALVDADYVRCSDYLRDIAIAGGGAIEISPDKVISFRKVDLRESPFTLSNDEAESCETTEDLDDYTNMVTVLATGTSGATANITRADSVEIALRQAVEGGSGTYQAYERVNHPTSNDVADLARLAVTTAMLILGARGRVLNSFRARLRRPLLDVGQLLTVDMPGMNLDSVYQITRLNMADDEGKLTYDIEAALSNKRYLNLESLLKIVGQAKTTVVVDSVENFQNTIEFTTPGAGTWNVPGIGTVQVEVDTSGAGGGGAGGITLQGAQLSSGRGGTGGRAVSFREYAAGTTLSYFIGTGGAGSTTDGSAGTSSYVNSPTETKVAEGFGGGGGRKLVAPTTGDGSPGQADGDYLYPGGGMPGGASGIGNGNTGAQGSHGKIIIRY